MLFSEVINQHTAAAQLTGMVRNNRLSHALLLLGHEGAGGLPLGLAFAQYIVCINRGEQDACGQCDQCRKAAAFVHPDIHYSYPVVPKKPGDKPVSTDYIRQWREFLDKNPYGNVMDWLQFIGSENKQGNITAQECHEIIHKLSYKSFESEYKILLVWMPEYLGKEGNRLLKLIEEPPPGTIFILVAQNQENILGTLLSRTQLVKLGTPGKDEISHALMQRTGVNAQAAGQIAHICDGNFREALILTVHGQTDLLEQLRAWLNYIFTGQAKALSDWIEEVSAGKTARENQKNFLRYFITLLEHALRLQYLDPRLIPLTPDESDFAERLNKKLDFFQAEKMIRLLDEACYQIERNANSKILFHALSIRMGYIFSRKPLPL
ncbi:MAG TPA: hypothetical protein VNE41_09795 [Chitinophagaceae bacterium]|nr:hypothetical protein [Chitinophagaceae bacterium]